MPALCLDAVRLVWQASPAQLLTTLVLQVFAAAGIGVQLLILKRMLSELIAVNRVDGPLSSVAPEFGLLIATIVGLGVITALIAHQQRLLVELVGRHAFNRIIDVASSVELRLFETPSFYDQLQRARSSGTQRSVDVVNGVSNLVQGLITSAGIAIVLAFLEPLLLVLVIVAAVPVLIATVFNSRAAYTFEYALTPESRERMYTMDLLTGRGSAKEIRVFGSEGFLRLRYDTLTAERLRRLREFLGERLKVSLLGAAAGAIGTAIALGALGVMVVDDRIDIATALVAALAMQQLASRLASITMNAGRIIESGMFIDDFNAFLQLAPPTLSTQPTDVQSDRSSSPAGAHFASLALDNISFSYPNTSVRVLENVSLRVDAGEVVALVGENGSGKTTLVKLICQLYEPDEGQVMWNGHDARLLGAGALREETTVIFQDFIHYHLSARDNIALGRVERASDHEAIVAAAVQAGADEFISDLPSAYDTRLGRQFYGGHELSVGQWQRLALARAFFRGGGFLILDEPTASLDPRAEHRLFNQIRGLAKGRSVLLVSHRFSSVRSADRIYVIERGRIVESGDHQELMSLDGLYAELFRLQQTLNLRQDEEAS